MEDISNMRELFHGILNHFNAISTISFALADILEKQSHSKFNARNTADLNLRIENEIDAIEEAYLLSRGDIKKLSRIIYEELDLENETSENFTKIEALLNVIGNKLKVSRELFRVSGGKAADSMLSLTKELYSFEESCINLGKLVRKIKEGLILLELYKTS
ncbi:MAG: hypothetical protein KJ995_06435 [Candidatus Omnitrophica bacterium]|nr:hypothetical protein [Candidatus Omnitrophota bacterium]MBU1128236.1 hypothetical protein [Candidatus Omnitrophota bacterium]MBU1784213.1 hypothetical protein [Candidatus Omnitrophota bacterium]MBU1852020.1 hypothetical protein [Candidatus Omnitrophota bacterium]